MNMNTNNLNNSHISKKTFQLENLAALIVGAWVLATPLIGGQIPTYRGAHVYLWNFAFVGATVICMSVFSIKKMVAWAERVNIIAGTWLLVSPLFLIYFNLSNFYFWNAVISGTLIAFFSAFALPAANHVIYHKHIKSKEDEHDCIPVLKPRHMHQHS